MFIKISQDLLFLLHLDKIIATSSDDFIKILLDLFFAQTFALSSGLTAIKSDLIKIL